MISITEVAERTGLRPSALRYYEEVGLITSPARGGGRRLYQDSVVERLRLIASVQSCGFTIAEIRELLVEDGCTPERWKPLAQRKLAEVGALIDKAKLTRRVLEESLDCECRALEDCVLTTGPVREQRRTSEQLKARHRAAT